MTPATTLPRPWQFSISAMLAALAVVAVTLGVSRVSAVGGIALGLIALPALLRTWWAHSLRRRAGACDSRTDVVSMYFLSLAIMLLVGLASTGTLMLAALIGAFFDPFGSSGVPIRVAIAIGLITHVAYFWVARPRPPHYLP